MRYKKKEINLLVLLFACCVTLETASKSKKLSKKKKDLIELPAPSKPNLPITIFVHGTKMVPMGDFLPSFIARPMSRHLAIPPGFKHVSQLPKKHAFIQLARVLSDADPIKFPLDNFYFFGWSGALGVHARFNAAKQLFNYILELKQNNFCINSPVTLITHSHGGNVAFSLASSLTGSLAGSECDNKNISQDISQNISIDRLIMLATPVQDATKHYVSSKQFKQIFHLYSPQDMVQILDPQGLRSKRRCKNCKDIPSPSAFFSTREFKAAPNLIQAHIYDKQKALGHIDFIQDRFFSKIPAILQKLIKKSTENKTLTENVFDIDLCDLTD